MAGDGFPGVIWIPAHKDRFTAKRSRAIDAVVLHCTDGKAVDAEQTARNVFANPKDASGHQSAHYIIGRNGNVVQCVYHKDVAHHAHGESATSIGIEHNARDPNDTTLTDIQYQRSAELVVFICRLHGLPLDEWYIWGHAEIDTKTTHRTCPHRALNWTTWWTAAADAQQRAFASGIQPWY
jgi:N-acetyl-anhydromuramyl-L-alanine amidase AmpD